MSRRLWLIASFFYIGALITNLAFFLSGECGFAFVPGAQPLFVGMILVLLVFEWWAYRRFGDRMTRRTGVGLLIAHMLLFEVTLAVDCTATTTLLYLLIPFMAYLYVNKWAAIGLALLYSVWFSVYFSAFRVDSMGDYLFRAVIFGLSMIFSLSMASLVKGVLISQAEERRLHRRLEAAHSQLEAYAAQVKELGASEERNRLARDIHDGVGHYLAAVTVQLEKALAFLGSKPEMSELAIIDAKQAAREALRDVRRSVGALRQSSEFFSLTLAIKELVRQSASDQLTIDLKMEGSEIDFSKATLMTLYRVAQEGLTNVQRHSGADHASVSLQLGTDGAILTVADDGEGFVVGGSSDQHQGLRGMRERLELIDGILTIESSPQGGTKVIAVVPKQQRSVPEVPA